VSSKINLEKYFSQYADLLSETLFREHVPLEDDSDHLYQISHLMQIEPSECEDLANKCSLSLLDCKIEGDTTADVATTLRDKRRRQKSRWKNIPEVGLRFLGTLVFQKGLLTKDSGKAHVMKQAVIKKFSVPNFVRNSETKPILSLKPKEIVLTIRMYNPFKYIHSEKMKVPTHSQDFLVLGSQPLSALRDKISCLNDSIAVGDLTSTSPDAAQVAIKELIPSGMFFIGDTFYCDFRDTASKDYGEWIASWAKENSQLNFGPFQHKAMEEATFEDLDIRFGLPYLFMHLGSCEHLFCFIDARFMTVEDPADVSLYPLVEEQKPKLQRCLSCELYQSKWIVEGNERLPYDPAFLCDSCFRGFHFDASGNKIGTFRYFPYPQTSMESIE